MNGVFSSNIYHNNIYSFCLFVLFLHESQHMPWCAWNWRGSLSSPWNPRLLSRVPGLCTSSSTFWASYQPQFTSDASLQLRLVFRPFCIKTLISSSPFRQSNYSVGQASRLGTCSLDKAALEHRRVLPASASRGLGLKALIPHPPLSHFKYLFWTC